MIKIYAFSSLWIMEEINWGFVGEMEKNELLQDLLRKIRNWSKMINFTHYNIANDSVKDKFYFQCNKIIIIFPKH